MTKARVGVGVEGWVGGWVGWGGGGRKAENIEVRQSTIDQRFCLFSSFICSNDDQPTTTLHHSMSLMSSDDDDQYYNQCIRTERGPET